MNLILQITARVVPVALIAGVAWQGLDYWKRPVERVEKSKGQAKAKAPREIRSPKTAPKPKIRGLKTHFQHFEKQDYQIQLKTQGVVSPTNVTSITAQVSGRIKTISDKFANGAFVKEGEVLASLETEDFEAAIVSSEASLARSQANLAQEVARGEQALRNWKDIGFKEEPNELVLRKPQLKEAQANVKSAEANLARAIRNKERCVIRAPFSGVIRNRTVGIGAVIGGSSKLGEILSTNKAEVRLPLSQDQLDQLAKSGDLFPHVQFSSALQPESDKTWEGKITRSEGEMDPSSRELYLIAEIEDPFSLLDTHTYHLAFNQPVMATIPAQILEDVYVVKREFIRGLRDIVTVKNGRLERVKLEPVWEDPKHLIVLADSIDSKAVLATSNLSYAVEGAKVTLVDKNGERVNLKEQKKKSEEKKSETPLSTALKTT